MNRFLLYITKRCVPIQSLRAQHDRNCLEHQLFSASASKFTVFELAINGFNAKTEEFENRKIRFHLNVMVAVFNQNRTEIFGYRMGLIYTVYMYVYMHIYI